MEVRQLHTYFHLSADTVNDCSAYRIIVHQKLCARLALCQVADPVRQLFAEMSVTPSSERVLRWYLAHCKSLLEMALPTVHLLLARAAECC